MLDIAERLNKLETGLGGYVLKTEIKEGWECTTSSAGIKIARKELDKDITWGFTSISAAFASQVLSELFPANFFTKNPKVDIEFTYALNTKHIFLTAKKQSPSKDYTGEVQILLIDNDAGGNTVKPTKGLLTIYAEGL